MDLSIKDRQLTRILFILLGAGLLGVIIANLFIYPLFAKVLITNTEHDAVTIGRHIATMISSGDEEDFAHQIRSYAHHITQMQQNFSLFKVKAFNAGGITIFSTDESDIGTRNEYPFFHNDVARGRIVSKTVKKNTRSLEGRKMHINVVETYVPVLRRGQFVGALEIYVDITEQNAIVDKAVLFSNLLSAGFILAFLMVCLIVIRQADANIKERDDARNFLRMTNIDLKNEIESRIQAEKEKERVIGELEDALLKLKVLKGLVPICSFCKNIRNDAGYWEKIEEYVEKHSDAEFSHGLCPECAAKHYPDMDLTEDDETYAKKQAEEKNEAEELSPATFGQNPAGREEGQKRGEKK